MPKCLARSCHHTTGKKNLYPEITFHQFPQNVSLCKLWLKKAGMEDFLIEKYTQMIFEDKTRGKFRMCSAHFQEDCFVTKGYRRYLKQNAVPTIFQQDGINRKQSKDPWKRRVIKKARTEDMAGTSSQSDRFESFFCDCQCHKYSFEEKKSVLNNSTQTDPTEFVSKVVVEPYIKLAQEINISNDHAYAKQEEALFPEIHDFTTVKVEHPEAFLSFDITPVQIITEQRESHIEYPLSSNLETPVAVKKESPSVDESFEQTFKPFGQYPNNYYFNERLVPPETELTSNISMSVVQESDTHHQSANNVPRQTQLIQERKFIVFESCLDVLISNMRCPEKDCFSPIKMIRKHALGSHLIVYSECQVQHHFKLWESQPYIQSVPAGNVLLAASIVLSGSNFPKVKEMFDYTGVKLFSETTFQNYQSRFIFPGIDHTWSYHKTQIKNELGKKSLLLAGDGHCDSPGFSAKYGTYTFMDIITKKIVDLEVAQATQCTSSLAVEKHAFATLLDRILAENYAVHVIGTDRHPGIRKMMKTHPYSDIIHQFDLWHYIKRLKKKLLQLSQKSNCSSLAAWIGSILNHLCWCSRTCRGSQEYFKERWESLLYHITNVHHWEVEGREFHCSHGEINSEDPVVPWLQRNSASFEVLTRFIKSPQIEKDIPHLTYFCQTGAPETFHRMMKKLRQEGIHYTFDSMEAQTKLAAIVHNNNVRRNPATVKIIKEGCELEFSKGRKNWVVREVYESKNDDHVIPIMSNIIDIIEGNIASMWVSKNETMPSHIDPVKRPPKEQAIQQQQRRFPICEITNPSPS